MVIILRGVQGSGKTFFWGSGALKKFLNLPPDTGQAICSADFFMVNERNEYEFVSQKLPECHAKCLLGFVEAVMEPRSSRLIVVDNTNSTVAEIAPYYALGQAYGHEVKIFTIDYNLDLAASRQVHGVSQIGIGIVAERLRVEEKFFPPWWDHQHVRP